MNTIKGTILMGIFALFTTIGLITLGCYSVGINLSVNGAVAMVTGASVTAIFHVVVDIIKIKKAQKLTNQ